jgi:ParB-like chromosome segregation protein Spo0J
MTTLQYNPRNGASEQDPIMTPGQAGDVRLVPLASIIVDDKNNARTAYDNIEELAEQIKLQGLLTPLTVDQNLTLWAGFRRYKALKIIHKGDKDALVKVTVRPIEQRFQGMLINIGENTGRRSLNDHDLAKVLHELDDENGPYAIKRKMLERQSGLSRSMVSMLITTYRESKPELRKAWAASIKGELKDVKDKPVTIPTTRIAQWAKKEDRDQHKHLAAFLDNDRPTLDKTPAHAEPEPVHGKSKEPPAPTKNGKTRAKREKDEGVGRKPTKGELRAELERLEAKDEKEEGLEERDMGRYQMIRWVLGAISRPY